MALKICIVGNKKIVCCQLQVQFWELKRSKKMSIIFFFKKISRCSKAKTALLIEYKRRSAIYIFKTNLKESKVFADITFQADICIVISSIIPDHIKFSECLNIPFLISRFIPVLSMQPDIVHRL